MRPPAGLLPIACCLALAGCGKKPPPAAADPAPGFWIWHRSSALGPAEEQALQRSGASRLYRQMGEFGWREGEWSARPLGDAGVFATRPGMIPVVRIDPGPSFLKQADAAAMLARWVRHRFGEEGVPRTLQIDYDCPVRLLGSYAGMLRDLRGELGLEELSVTALASWIDAPAFPKLGEAADELVPMFYDLTADPPRDIVGGKARPMAGPEAAAWIARWKSCRTPWRAGLANFERLTLFEADGKLAGHLRQWSPESVLGASFLEPIPGFSGGAGYRVIRRAALHGTPLEASQILVWRAPGDDDLRDLVAASFAAGARGIVWFALPGPGLRASRSPSHLAALARGESPAAAIRIDLADDGRIVLRNDGPGDLASPPGAPLHRLTLESDQAATFAATGPGAFFELLSPVPAAFSRKIVLSFPRLSVGEEIASESGLIPARDGRELQWSIDDSPPAPLP